MQAVRDAKGCYLPGHPGVTRIIPGRKGGHPKTLNGQVKDALKIAEDAMPSIVLMLIGKAQSGDVQAAKILLDRIYGMPNQPLSNKDGSKLQSFVFSLPPGMVPGPGGLFLGKN